MRPLCTDPATGNLVNITAFQEVPSLRSSALWTWELFLSEITVNGFFAPLSFPFVEGFVNTALLQLVWPDGLLSPIGVSEYPFDHNAVCEGLPPPSLQQPQQGFSAPLAAPSCVDSPYPDQAQAILNATVTISLTSHVLLKSLMESLLQSQVYASSPTLTAASVELLAGVALDVMQQMACPFATAAHYFPSGWTAAAKALPPRESHPGALRNWSVIGGGDHPDGIDAMDTAIALSAFGTRWDDWCGNGEQQQPTIEGEISTLRHHHHRHGGGANGAPSTASHGDGPFSTATPSAEGRMSSGGSGVAFSALAYVVGMLGVTPASQFPHSRPLANWWNVTLGMARNRKSMTRGGGSQGNVDVTVTASFVMAARRLYSDLLPRGDPESQWQQQALASFISSMGSSLPGATPPVPQDVNDPPLARLCDVGDDVVKWQQDPQAALWSDDVPSSLCGGPFPSVAATAMSLLLANGVNVYAPLPPSTPPTSSPPPRQSTPTPPTSSSVPPATSTTETTPPMPPSTTGTTGQPTTGAPAPNKPRAWLIAVIVVFSVATVSCVALILRVRYVRRRRRETQLLQEEFPAGHTSGFY